MTVLQPSPIQLIHARLAKEWETNLEPLPATQLNFCVGFHWPKETICEQLDETPTFESDATWDAKEKILTFSNLIERPLLVLDHLEEMFRFLLKASIPHVEHMIPDTGLKGCMTPLYASPPGGKRYLAAGYVGTILWSGSQRGCDDYIAQLTCSTRMLFLSRAVISEAAAKKEWPSHRRCNYLLAQAHEEYQVLRESIDEDFEPASPSQFV